MRLPQHATEEADGSIRTNTYAALRKSQDPHYVPARCSPRCRGPTDPATIRTVHTFLIEVHMAGAGAQELTRAVRMLEGAQTRMLGSATVTRTTLLDSVGRMDGSSA